MTVQSFQSIVIIYRKSNFVYFHSRCTSIYRPLSYPFWSLQQQATLSGNTNSNVLLYFSLPTLWLFITALFMDNIVFILKKTYSCLRNRINIYLSLLKIPHWQPSQQQKYQKMIMLIYIIKFFLFLYFYFFFVNTHN